MRPTSTLTDDLERLTRRWEQLTDTPETPETSMGVIEYSLGSQRRAEVYVNRLLRYFLDPEAPHGMDGEFLQAFLRGLPPTCEFQEDIHDLSTVRVREQVHVGAPHATDGRTGDVDLVIDVPNEYFLLVELKFGADEGNLHGNGLSQTQFYAETSTIDGVVKEEYESGHYYVYLHHGGPSQAEAFVDWTWGAFLDDVVHGILSTGSARFPMRTVVQLNELIDDIQEITDMTDQHDQEDQKVELYLDHRDAIEDVRSKFEARWDRFTDEWGNELADRLANDGYTVDRAFGDDLVTVEVPHRSDGTTRFVFRTASSDWGVLFREGWWRHLDDLDVPTYSRPDDYNDARIGFVHRLERHRDLAIDERTLKVSFRNMGANDGAFIDAFQDQFERRDIGALLPSQASLTGNKLNMIDATYDIQVRDHNDLFDAYTAALHQAFRDLAVENEELIGELTEAYDEALSVVYR